MSSGNTMIVGLTGQTGAGKSTLSRMFAEHGVETINADEVARDTMENSKLVLMDLVLEFSTEVIHPDATLNREKLAEICFSDKKKLKRLNEITYPHIIKAIAHKIETARANGAAMVLLDAPTLYESGLDKDCDWVAAVIADKETRILRIIQRDSMTEEAALRRINAQPDDAFYRARADDILVNNEDEDALQLNFMALYGRLERMAADGSFREKRKAVHAETAPAPEGDLEELTEQND